MRLSTTFLCITLILVACSHSPEQYTLAEKQYIDRVLKKIEIIGEHRYAALTKDLAKRVELVVAIQISHGGTLQAVNLLQSSGQSKIDHAILELIRYSAPYPPMPDSIHKSSLMIHKRWFFQPAN